MKYDSDRVSLFQTLFDALKQEEFPYIEEPNKTDASFRNFAIFESYFSNVENETALDIDDVRMSLTKGKPWPPVNKGFHDVLGTFRVVSDRKEMSRTPRTYEELVGIMLYRHSIIMSAKPERHPGCFKSKNNHVGDTVFVEHSLVEGTIQKGFEYYLALDNPFARALFMQFMVTEVHPFCDGNGRMSRIMLNAELVAAGESKVIVPTAFRYLYYRAQRKLTKEGDPSLFIQDMQRVRRFSAKLTGEDFSATSEYLEKCNAFRRFFDMLKDKSLSLL